jgi:hypothetical protein
MHENVNEDVNAVDRKGCTPLFLAVSMAEVSMVR